MEGHLEVASSREMVKILEARKPWIEAQLLWRLAHPQIVGAYNVLRGKRLAVMPLDAEAQLEGEPHAVFAPCPRGREIGDDRLEADLFNALIEQRQIIENPHHRPNGENGGFLHDGHGGRAVRRVDSERATGLLRQDGAGRSHA